MKSLYILLLLALTFQIQCSWLPSISKSLFYLGLIGSTGLVTYVSIQIKETLYLKEYSTFTKWSESPYPIAQLLIDYSLLSHPFERKRQEGNSWIGGLVKEASVAFKYKALEFGRELNHKSLPRDFKSTKWSEKFKTLLQFDLNGRFKQIQLGNSLHSNLPLIIVLLMKFKLNDEIINFIYNSFVTYDNSKLKEPLLFLFLSDAIKPWDPAFQLIHYAPDCKVIVMLKYFLTKESLDELKSRRDQLQDEEFSHLLSKFDELQNENYLQIDSPSFAAYLNNNESIEIQAILVMKYILNNLSIDGIFSLVRPFVSNGMGSLMIPLTLELMNYSRDLIDSLIMELRGENTFYSNLSFQLGEPLFKMSCLNTPVDYYSLLLIPISDGFREGILSTLPTDFFEDIYKKSNETVSSIPYSILLTLLITDSNLKTFLELPILRWEKTEMDYFFDSISIDQFHLFNWILSSTNQPHIQGDLVERAKAKLIAVHSKLIEQHATGKNKLVKGNTEPTNNSQLILHFLSNIKQSQQVEDQEYLINDSVNLLTQHNSKDQLIQVQTSNQSIQLPSIQYMNRYFIPSKDNSILSLGIILQFIKTIDNRNVSISNNEKQWNNSNNWTNQLQYLVDLLFSLTDQELRQYFEYESFLFFEYFCFYFNLQQEEKRSGSEKVKTDKKNNFDLLKFLNAHNSNKYSDKFIVGKNGKDFLREMRKIVQETFIYKWNSLHGIKAMAKRSFSHIILKPNFYWRRLEFVIDKCPPSMVPYLSVLLFDPLIIDNENCLEKILNRIINLNPKNEHSLCLALIASLNWSDKFYKLKIFLVGTIVNQLTINSTEDNFLKMTIALILYNLSNEISNVQQIEYVYAPLIQLVPIKMILYLQEIVLNENFLFFFEHLIKLNKDEKMKREKIGRRPNNSNYE